MVLARQCGSVINFEWLRRKKPQRLGFSRFRTCHCEHMQRRYGRADSLIAAGQTVYGPGVPEHRARDAGIQSRSLPLACGEGAAELEGSRTTTYSPPAHWKSSHNGIARTAGTANRKLVY